MYVAAARAQRARRAKGNPKGGKNGGKGGHPKGPKSKNKKKNRSGKGGAAEEATPGQDATLQQEAPAGEDLWTGTGVEFEALHLDGDGRPLEAE